MTSSSSTPENRYGHVAGAEGAGKLREIPPASGHLEGHRRERLGLQRRRLGLRGGGDRSGAHGTGGRGGGCACGGWGSGAHARGGCSHSGGCCGIRSGACAGDALAAAATAVRVEVATAHVEVAAVHALGAEPCRGLANGKSTEAHCMVDLQIAFWRVLKRDETRFGRGLNRVLDTGQNLCRDYLQRISQVVYQQERRGARKEPNGRKKDFDEAVHQACTNTSASLRYYLRLPRLLLRNLISASGDTSDNSRPYKPVPQ
ncbi:hypothetical protein B0H14DRAFT_3730712 [Mycena olivaceomarginata]|nr:hypothetical protein B0H14DRAFT_3772528 [Mycena olivaceomarginata]KAJ7886461.1 hypothetical protein B0H14DRAFT_3730712 [Mycena olivaceomarginata]